MPHVAVPMVASPTLLAIGLVLLLLGWWMRRWASRHDLRDLAVGAAWQAAKDRNIDAVKSSALGEKLGEVMSETSKAGMARRAAGIGIRGAAAQFVGMAGLIGIFAGLALMAAGVFWR